MGQFNPDVNAYRFYEDGTESGSTPMEDQDTDTIINVDGGNQQVHLRLRVDEVGGKDGAATDDYDLEYSKNGGTWTNITSASANVRSDTGSSLTNDDPTTNRATNGISDPASGSFVAGVQKDSIGTIIDHQLTSGNFTEHVFALLVVAADVSNGNTLDFRLALNGGTPGMDNNVTPTITIQKTSAAAVKDIIGAGIIPWAR